MAVVQIPNLPAAIALSGNEEMEAVQAGVSVRTTTAKIAQLASPFAGSPLTVPMGGTGLSSGTSGGLPYFSGSTTMASSALLANNALMLGGGAGGAPKTTTTGTGVVTALGVNIGTAGSVVVNGGALGTPSSGTLTNATGLPIAGISGLGSGVGAFLATPSSANLAAAVTDETGSGSLVFASAPTITSPVLVTPALGVPTSGTLTNCTGLPISGIFNLGTGVGTFLATPTSANLASAITDETGSGSLVFATSPTLVTPTLGVASATSINKVAITAPATSATLTIADGKTLTASNTLTFTGTDTSSVAFGTGGTVAYTANNLSVFAATTSAQLAGVISDETGSGVLVFATGPSLSKVSLAAGTATAGTAPLKLTSGTNLTAAEVGAVEYDGSNFYVTPDTSQTRVIVRTAQQFYLAATGGAFGATIGNFFGVNSAASLAANSSYEIDIYCYFLKTTSGTLTWAPTFSSNATVAHAILDYTPVTGFTTTNISGAMVSVEATQQTVGAMTFAATAALTAAVYHIAKFKIFVLTNAACDFRLNVTQSAGTITPQAGSYYMARKIVSTSGNFVA